MVRLLNVYDLKFRVYLDEDQVPPYAIASHRWYDPENETTYKDFFSGLRSKSSGYQKVLGFAEYVREHVPNVQWLWIDTCCIDKTDNAEVSEAIISMFRWYSKSEVCLVYLYNVNVNTDEGLCQLRESDWFSRGWTLQELLAPQVVVFVTKSWQVIGHTGESGSSGMSVGPSIESLVHQITGIPRSVVHDYKQGEGLTVEQKFKWAARRTTSRKEDMAYCMFGLFDVSLPVLYGEGLPHAQERLHEEIQKKTKRTSVGRRTIGVKEGTLVSSMRTTSTNILKLEGATSNKSSKAKVDLNQHQKNLHLNGPELKCPDCPKYFKSKDVKQHRRAKHGSVFPSDCRFCLRSFPNDSARDQHIRDSHS